MSGSGRRTHYRKHLTDSVLHDFPEPLEHERIAKVVGTRGSNQFEIVVASSVTSETSPTHTASKTKKDASTTEASDAQHIATDQSLQIELAILPTKFRKLVWLKRNDFVICECANDDDINSTTSSNTNQNGGIRFMIKHILYKDQVKHLKQKHLWPNDFFFSDDIETSIHIKTTQEEANNLQSDVHNDNASTARKDEQEDGIVYNQEYLDEDDTNNDDLDEYFINSNRIAKLTIHDDSSSDEDSD